MIALLAAQALIAVEFSPPLVFVGERFSFTSPVGMVAEDAKGASVGGSSGVAKRPDAEFWLTKRADGELKDAALIQVPTATVPRWKSWPATSGWHQGSAFVVTDRAMFALVPMRGNYGICRVQDGIERRRGNILDLDIAVRSGPMHNRPILAETIYAGGEFVTLYCSPARVANVVLRISPERVDVVIVALYAQRGTLTLLGTKKAFSLKPGETLTLSTDF